MILMNEKLLKRAISMLKTIECQFAIVDPDGVKHGTLELVKPKRKRTSATPYGSLTKHIAQFLENIQPGQTVHIPTMPELRLDKLQTNCCNYMSRSLKLSKNDYTTYRDKEINCLSVTRFLKVEE